MEAHELYTILDEYRDTVVFGRDVPIEVISEFIPDADVARELIQETRLFSSNGVLPFYKPFIEEFILQLLTEREIKSVLDPWSNIGTVLKMIDDKFKPEKVQGYVINQDSKRISDNLFGYPTQLGHSISLAEQDSSKYDLIISNLPIGLKGRDVKYGIPKNEESYQIIASAVKLLNTNGLAIFNITSSITSDNLASNKLLEFLKNEGVAVKALFGLPAKSINALTSVKMELLVLSKEEQKRVFVGEVKDNEVDNELLIQNYKKNKKGKTALDGIWIDITNLKTAEQIDKEKQLDISLRRTGLQVTKLVDVAERKNIIRDVLNRTSLLIPRLSTLPVLTINSSDERLDKILTAIEEGSRIGLLTQYMMLDVDETLANVDYIAKTLNSPLGKQIRDTRAIGNIQPSISPSLLSEIDIPLPTIEIQNTILELSSDIETQRDYLNQLNKDLWKTPSKLNDTEKLLKKLLKDKDSIEWMESLPFPVASILWGYHSESSTEKKVEYLLLFFEGLCQFLGVLLLSPIANNKSFYESNGKSWLKNDKLKTWYEKASFGGWIWMYESLSKNVRKMLNNENDKEYLREVFGNPSTTYFDGITSKKLASVFRGVSSIRNSFKGHGGVTSEAQYKVVLQQLESQLHGIRELIVETFSEVKMLHVVPKTMSWDEDNEIYESTCRILNGTRSKFNKETAMTSKPLSPKELYLIHHGQYVAVKLLPLIQMRESPKTEQNAFYFYNRIDGDSVRMVSYHFEKDAELTDSIDGFSKAIEILKTED